MIVDIADACLYTFNFFTEFSKITFKIDCQKRSTYSDPIFDWNGFVFPPLIVISKFVSLSSTLRILILSSSRMLQ